MTETLENNTRIPLELLAPAGGMEQLEAAIRFGADAVYLATENFGMRARATNFTLDELPQVVAYAHRAGVKVHVACNVLMFPSDTLALPAYFEQVQSAGADALIIGDLGAFRLARRYAPDVALHVSTQASVANAEAARMWYELGASRIVCAREMSLDDIAQLRADAPTALEIEAFAHGAMCMAVSGRCLISSYLTGRSGNRGHCTQPCRWNYRLEEERRPGEFFPVEEDERGAYLFNANDLNMLSYLRQLADVGVDSIKIEGRNKKAFYVATVVGAYRRVLDGEPAECIAPELESVSHRPYSTGFFFGEAPQSPDYDGYEQTCLHVADVVACEKREERAESTQPDAENRFADEDSEAHPSRRFSVTVRCRNRFAEKDVLEVLEPHHAAKSDPCVSSVRTVEIRDLTWLPAPDEDGTPNPPAAVAVANRTCELYRFTADKELFPGSFLRMRKFRRSARHEETR